MSASDNLTIRAARPEDAEEIIRLLDDFNAVVEDEPTTLTPDDIRRDGFGADSWFFALIAEWDGRPAGYAIATRAFHPQRRGRGFHLVDLYVEAAVQRHGLGRALMRAVARHCREQGGHWLDWDVWVENARAYAFYEALGARHVRDASIMVLEEQAFWDLAGN